LEKCTKLEELSFQNNFLQSLNGLETLENLRKLDLSQNEIIYYDENQLHKSLNGDFKNWDIDLPRLTHLSISNNKISSIKFVKKMPALIEIYASFNQIKLLRDIFNLKQLVSLAILDLCANPMCKENNKYRLFLIYHLKNLKSLDGTSIESNEITESRDLFGGKLTCDFIAEKCNHNKLNEIKVLEFVQCSIRHVDLGPNMSVVNEQFESLRSLNLENNFLTSFSGLIYLKNLKILCLNNNKIESIFPKGKHTQTSSNSSNQVQVQVQIIDKILPNLEVLHLAYNGITDLVNLQIGLLSTLKVLFLQGIFNFI
jgi:Leucine-rich repeat (LRR) protein